MAAQHGPGLSERAGGILLDTLQEEDEDSKKEHQDIGNLMRTQVTAFDQFSAQKLAMQTPQKHFIHGKRCLVVGGNTRTRAQLEGLMQQCGLTNCVSVETG